MAQFIIYILISLVQDSTKLNAWIKNRPIISCPKGNKNSIARSLALILCKIINCGQLSQRSRFIKTSFQKLHRKNNVKNNYDANNKEKQEKELQRNAPNSYLLTKKKSLYEMTNLHALQYFNTFQCS